MPRNQIHISDVCLILRQLKKHLQNCSIRYYACYNFNYTPINNHLPILGV